MKGRKIHPIGEGHSEEYRPLVIFTDFRLHCIWFCVSIIKEIRRRQWHPTPALLPGRSHGWRSLEGCSPWGRWGLDMTERLQFYFSLSLSCIGEGSGNPLQCYCVENPRDRGAWWAAIYGVAQSWTWLKWLSSSSSSTSFSPVWKRFNL